MAEKTVIVVTGIHCPVCGVRLSIVLYSQLPQPSDPPFARTPTQMGAWCPDCDIVYSMELVDRHSDWTEVVGNRPDRLLDPMQLIEMAMAIKHLPLHIVKVLKRHNRFKSL